MCLGEWSICLPGGLGGAAVILEMHLLHGRRRRSGFGKQFQAGLFPHLSVMGCTPPTSTLSRSPREN